MPQSQTLQFNSLKFITPFPFLVNPQQSVEKRQHDPDCHAEIVSAFNQFKAGAELETISG
jgi:hypothetical protein